ncbi:MAG: cadherin-like beta sandwich domain-containing protein [Clostridia bacterium]|nr:cadherin-like beta sandwich domain-containing protein [Clostridia bacterium]
MKSLRNNIIAIIMVLTLITYSFLGVFVHSSYAEDEGTNTDNTMSQPEHNTENQPTDNPVNEPDQSNPTTESTSNPENTSGNYSGTNYSNSQSNVQDYKRTVTPVTNSIKKSSNANLSNLGIRPNDFSGFKSETTTYAVTVPEDVEQVEVYAQAQDSRATVEGTGNKKLEKGTNGISVVVTAEDGTKKTYVINVTREGNEAEQNPNGIVDGLSELKIDNVTLNPEFKTDIFEYTLKYIGEDTKLNIETVTTDPYFIVEITGNEDLKEGENLITILVSDPDGKNVATYQITVNKSLVDEEALAKEQEEARRKEEQKKKLILGGVIAIVIIAIIIFVIIRNRRNREFAEEYTVPFEGLNDDDYIDEYEEELDYDEDEYTENHEFIEDTELSKEQLKKKFLDNYDSYDYEDEDIEEKAKRKRHKAKRFK